MQKKSQKNISYILHFIDSARFMGSSLSNLAKKYSEGIHTKKECKLDDLIDYKC